MIKKILKVTYDILRGFNGTLFGWAAKEAQKVSKIVKNEVTGVDIVIETSHTFENFTCNDPPICGTIDVIGSLSSAVGLALGNIESTKHLTVVTGSLTVSYR